MEAKAQARFVRVTPMKARRVVDLIRGKQAEEADEAFNKGFFYNAIELYKKAYTSEKKASEKAVLIFKVAEVYRALGDAENAEVWYERANKAQYPDPITYYYIGEALKEQGKYAEAIAAFRATIAGESETVRQAYQPRMRRMRVDEGRVADERFAANYGGVHAALELIEEAAAAGQDVAADVYPYTAGATTLREGTHVVGRGLRLAGREQHALLERHARADRHGEERILADPDRHARLVRQALVEPVEQRTTAGFGPIEIPGGFGVDLVGPVVAELDPCCGDLADLSVAAGLGHRGVGPDESHAVGGYQHLSLAGGGLQQGVGISHGEGHRRLDQHMLAGLDRRHGHFSVQVVRGADVDGIDVGRGHELAPIVGGHGLGRGGIGRGLSIGQVLAGEPGHLGAGRFERRKVHSTGYVAASDDPYP